MIEMIRGDTFEQIVDVQDAETGSAVDITGWTIASHVRQSRVLVSALQFTLVNATIGQFSLKAIGGTEKWPLAILVQDIKYIDTAGDIVHTEKLFIRVDPEVTP